MITVLESKIEDLTADQIPEGKVDVLISEPLGTFLLNERMLETYVIEETCSSSLMVECSLQGLISALCPSQTRIFTTNRSLSVSSGEPKTSMGLT